MNHYYELNYSITNYYSIINCINKLNYVIISLLLNHKPIKIKSQCLFSLNIIVDNVVCRLESHNCQSMAN